MLRSLAAPSREGILYRTRKLDGRLLTILASLYKTQETLYIDATVKLLQMHTSELITMSDVSRGLRTLKLTRKMVNT